MPSCAKLAQRKLRYIAGSRCVGLLARRRSDALADDVGVAGKEKRNRKDNVIKRESKIYIVTALRKRNSI